MPTTDIETRFEFLFEQGKKRLILRLEELKDRAARRHVNWSDAQVKALISGHAVESAAACDITEIPEDEKRTAAEFSLLLLRDPEVEALQKELWELIERSRTARKPWWKR
jgi:hypothetical protein